MGVYEGPTMITLQLACWTLNICFVPIDLNHDGYMDFVIFDNGDEGIKGSPDEPIRIVLSDGKGHYDLKAIETSELDILL